MIDDTRGPNPPTKDRSTHFRFEHKLFSVEGGYFAPAVDTKETLFHIPLGDIRGAISLEVLRAEFHIKPDSPDGRLLGVIDRSLRFVKEIRPNDSIPRELLDGSASWSVEPVHRQTAQNRLTVQLVSWMAGEEIELANAEALNALAAAPETKEKVQIAFGQIADKLEMADKQQVVDLIDGFVRELAYIEALRDRCRRAHDIGHGIEALMRIYRSDRSLLESLERMRRLIKPPLAGFAETFAQVDAQTGEILALLKNEQSQVAFIRETRDDLHCRLMVWDDVIERWDGVTPKRSEATEELIRLTYRFLAHNFPQSKPWKLGGY